MQGYQPKKSNELKKPPKTGSNVRSDKQMGRVVVDDMEITKFIIKNQCEIERLYNKMFDNCKHRSGWCKKGDCKYCQFMK